MSSTTLLDPINEAQAKLLLAERLYGGSAHDIVSVDCALLRSCVWALSGANEPVHILRISNFALSMCSYQEDIQHRRQQLRNALQELCDADDMIFAYGGYYLPAVTREVLLGSESDERLLVGGLPTSAIPTDLRQKVVHNGPYRRFRGPALGNLFELPKEDLEHWTGAPTESLENWAEQILSISLTPYTESGEETRLRIYAPELAKAQSSQLFRWFVHPERLTGRYLAIRERVFGSREYRIVELQDGKVVAINDSLAPGDGRLLMYALDLRADKPVKVRIRRKKNRLSITLGSELPRSEQRLFGAIGTLEISKDSYYPRVWRFTSNYEALVLQRLQKLGITLVERS